MYLYIKFFKYFGRMGNSHPADNPNFNEISGIL